MKQSIVHIALVVKDYDEAIDEKKNKVIGFVHAISDKVIYAFIPLLEVLPEYQKKGVARKLMINIEKQLSEMYAVDIVCDDGVAEFYSKLKYYKINGMIKRNPKK
jgi:ribosomal protein S18 acetylase RimI-like enzyme